MSACGTQPISPRPSLSPAPHPAPPAVGRPSPARAPRRRGFPAPPGPRPPSRPLPAVGRRSPARAPSSRVLPAPLAPSPATSRPGVTVRHTSFSSRRPPPTSRPRWSASISTPPCSLRPVTVVITLSAASLIGYQPKAPAIPCRLVRPNRPGNHSAVTDEAEAPGRFGVVGTGWRAAFFVRLGQLLPEVLTVTGLVGRTPERGAEVAAAWGTDAFGSAAQLVGESNPDFVISSVPWDANPAVVEQLVDLGVGVLSETPPAPDQAGLRELWDRVGPTGQVQVAEQY